MDMAHLQSLLGFQYQTSSTTSFPTILAQIKQTSHPLLTARLQELAEVLSVSTEESFMRQGGPRAIGLDINAFLKTLIGIINGVGENDCEEDYEDCHSNDQDEDQDVQYIEEPHHIQPESILLACRW